MVTAAFVVDGEQREVRDVPEKWLEQAQATHENVLLADGNPYYVVRVEYDEGRTAARVELAAPQFTRAS